MAHNSLQFHYNGDNSIGALVRRMGETERETLRLEARSRRKHVTAKLEAQKEQIGNLNRYIDELRGAEQIEPAELECKLQDTNNKITQIQIQQGEIETEITEHEKVDDLCERQMELSSDVIQLKGVLNKLAAELPKAVHQQVTGAVSIQRREQKLDFDRLASNQTTILRELFRQGEEKCDVKSDLARQGEVQSQVINELSRQDELQRQIISKLDGQGEQQNKVITELTRQDELQIQIISKLDGQGEQQNQVISELTRQRELQSQIIDGIRGISAELLKQRDVQM